MIQDNGSIESGSVNDKAAEFGEMQDLPLAVNLYKYLKGKSFIDKK